MTVSTVKSQVSDLKEKIASRESWALGALMRVYGLQDADERAAGQTAHRNGRGFNRYDDELLTNFAEQYTRKGHLSRKQIEWTCRLMPKYAGQIIKLGGMKSIKNRAGGKVSTKTVHMVEGDKLEIRYPHNYKNHKEIEEMRVIGNRRWHQRGGFWAAPGSVSNLHHLQRLEFTLDTECQDWMREHLMDVDPQPVGDIEGLGGELMPFQSIGVGFIESRAGRALLGDEPGLGKTMQALAWLQMRPEIRPAVIVCPASVKLNWVKETRIWMGIEPTMLSGRTPSRLGGMIDEGIYILNYDILANWKGELLRENPKVILLDEAHLIKNPKAGRTKAAQEMCKAIPRVIGITGTAIVNRPSEIYNIVKFIDPSVFPSYWAFASRYCQPKSDGYGWNTNGASNTKELHEILSRTIMIRRKKSEVLKDLPEKVRSVVPMEIDNRKEYKKAERDFIAWLRERDPDAVQSALNAEALVRIERLKQLTIAGKIKAACAWVEDFLSTGEKLVVFCTHKETVRILEARFKMEYVTLDGSTAAKDRQRMVDMFQENESARLFIGNLKAAGSGITLTAASNTCFFELGWTPGEHDQAEDRVHRIGQESDSVTAWYLLADGTIEMDIAEMLDEKRKVITSVLDGEDASEDSMLTKLMEKYKGMI